MKISRRNVATAVAGATVLRAFRPSSSKAASPSCKERVNVRTGFEVLQQEDFARLAGHKVGLIANQTSVDRTLRHIADVMATHKNVNLSALFGPEHGFRGTAAAGSSEARTRDARTGITVYDIYGVSGKDLNNASKKTLDQVFRDSGVDIVVFDIQDVGARFYTYIWTLFDSLAACARLGIRFMVLDRPNPITGQEASGPVLQPRFSSFVGLMPIALRHGMTVGELATLFNTHFIPHYSPRKAQLEIVHMEGWSRDLFYDQTDLPWTPPSPNLPTLGTAIVYPGSCLFEGTSLSVGRGTSLPFLQLGGVGMKAEEWVDAAMQAGLPGVLFREAWFSPTASVDQNQLVHGLQIVCTDRTRFDPVLTGVTLLSIAHGLSPDGFWRSGGATIDRLAGVSTVRSLIDRKASVPDIEASWMEQLRRFQHIRHEHLLY